MLRLKSIRLWTLTAFALFVSYMGLSIISPLASVAAAGLGTCQFTSPTNIGSCSFANLSNFNGQGNTFNTADSCAGVIQTSYIYTITVGAKTGSGDYNGKIQTTVTGPPCGFPTYNGDITIGDPNQCYNQSTCLGPGGGTGNSQSPEIVCSLQIFNPLTWLVCPLVSAAQGAVTYLSEGIDSLLTVNTCELFSVNQTCSHNPTSKEQQSSTGFYKAWNVMRIFAVGIIVIAGLVMLVAEATGTEAIDAYTIHKVMPRLLIAAIFITLSWPILNFVIALTNDLGLGIRALIYEPFNNIGQHCANGASCITIGGGSSSIAALVGSSALVALSLIGLGSFLLTALIGVFVGFLVLLVRQIIILALVIFAPIAVACYVLPGTEKAWQFWKDTFLSMLLLFPIVSALIAIGRVFSVVMYNDGIAGVPNFVNQIGAFILWFLPYFLLPKSVQWAGGAIANIGGAIHNAHGGLRKGLQQFRRSQAANRYHSAREGRGNYVGSRALGALYRRTSLGGNVLFARGRERYRTNVRNLYGEVNKKAMEGPAYAAAAGNDDANVLAQRAGMTRGRFVNDYQQMLIDRAAAAGTVLPAGEARAQANQALNELETGYRAQMGTQAMQAAAYKAYTASNAAYDVNNGDKRASDAALYEDTAALIDQGIISRAEGAAAIKSNKARPDRSAVGWGSVFGQIDRSLERYRAGTRGIDVVSQAESDELSHEVIRESNASDIIATSHMRSVRMMAPRYVQEFSDLMNRYSQRQAAGAPASELLDLRRQAEAYGATILGIYDQLGHVSQSKQDFWGEGVLGSGVRDDLSSGGQMVTIRKAIEGLRSRPAGAGGEHGVLERRREYQYNPDDPRVRPPAP